MDATAKASNGANHRSADRNIIIFNPLRFPFFGAYSSSNRVPGLHLDRLPALNGYTESIRPSPSSNRQTAFSICLSDCHT